MVHVTVRTFQEEVRNSKLPVLVMFYASWCAKCAMEKPVVEDLEKKYGNRIKFCEVEVEESAALAAEFGADIVPTFALLKDGEVEGIMQGVLGEEILEKRVKELL